MVKFSNIYQNIKFMIFNNFEDICTYVVKKITKAIFVKKNLNLSIESRFDFFSILEKLKRSYLEKKISFENCNFFMTDDFLFTSKSWKDNELLNNARLLEDNFFNFVNFKKENIFKIINNKNYLDIFNQSFSVYDSLIDKKMGIDILILKVHNDGSLIFNQTVTDLNLMTKGVKLNDWLIDELKNEFNEDEQNIPFIGATIGLDQILKAKKIFLIGVGQEKARLINKLFFTKAYDKRIPICLLKNHKNVEILCDSSSGKRIIQEVSINNQNDIDEFANENNIYKNEDDDNHDEDWLEINNT